MIDIVQDHISPPPQADPVRKQARKPHVVLLLDASGSMAVHADQVISTFNEYRQSVASTAKTISLYTFEGGPLPAPINLRELIFKDPPARVKNLTREHYVIAGMTPLYDCMAAVIRKFMGERRPVQFVTHTDGQENASSEFNLQTLTMLINERIAAGWLFTYLGEGLEGKAAVAHMPGLKFAFDSHNRATAMRGLSATTSVYGVTSSNVAGDYTNDGGDTIDVDSLVSGSGVSFGADPNVFKPMPSIEDGLVSKESGFEPWSKFHQQAIDCPDFPGACQCSGPASVEEATGEVSD